MSSSESDWSDGCPELEEDVDDSTSSLLSNFIGTPRECLQHDLEKYGWNLLTVGREEKFEIFDYLKCVNFLRGNKREISKAEFLQSVNLWKDEKFLQPAVQNDPFLCFDWDDIANDNVSFTGKIDDDRMKEIGKELEKNDQPIGVVKNEYYFDSYSDYSIHAEMLQDKVRTEAYRDAIYENKKYFTSKTVVDVGAGTGILSMFAAVSGASKVFSLEMADIAYDCIDIVRENGLDKTITVLKGKAEEQTEKIGKCDVIISEWMGYCLLYEGMLDSVIRVRDKVLAPDGIMIPASANIELCLMQNEQLWNYYTGFWDNVYGFKMNCMKKRTKGEAQVSNMDHRHVASELREIIKWDLKKCQIEDLSFSRDVQLEANVTGPIHGLMASFDCQMVPEENGRILSTSPLNESTHWKQTGFLFNEPIQVKQGDQISGKFQVKRNFKNERELKIFVQLSHDGRVICNQEYSVA